MLSNLPEEILNEIFSRIPAKSVGKLRCLSKTWKNRLTNSHFINSHLSCKTHQESLILLSPDNSLHVMKLPIESYPVSKKLELGNSWNKVLGSCNGIVLLLNWQEEMFLVNPSTLDQFKVPKLVFDSDKSPRIMLRGFGYDSSSDDYKILVISRLYSNIDNVSIDVMDMYHRSFDTSVDLYSVKTGVWRSIKHSLYWFEVCGSSCGAFTNGSIHWFVNRRSSESQFGTLAFNLVTELFSEVEMPLNFFGPDADCKVFSHEGCLCVMNPLWTVDARSSGKIDVWMLIEYGMPNSWTKLGTIDSNGKWDTCEPLCFRKDGEIVLVTCVSNAVGDNLEELTVTSERAMVVYKMQDGSVTDMVVNGVPPSFRDGIFFVDSLVLLKGIARGEGTVNDMVDNGVPTTLIVM